MLRMLGAAQKREVKATQNLAIIVGFFMICWIPLYTINCYLAFCNGCNVDMTFMNCCIILSHLNSAGNPLLYAYHLRDFRAAMKNFFCSLTGNTSLQPLQITKHRTSQHSQNYSTNSRIASTRESRSALNLTSNCKFVDSPLYCRAKSKSMFLPPQKLRTNGDAIREMWQIPELPSASDEKEPSQQIATIHPREDYGKINSGFSQDSIFATDDDYVYVDDTIPIAEFKNREVVVMRKTNVALSSPRLCDEFESAPRPCRYTRSYSDVDERRVEMTLRGSPYKTVGELLLNPKHARTLSEGSSVSSDADLRRVSDFAGQNGS